MIFVFLCTTNTILDKKIIKQMSEINNSGKKGYCMLYAFTAFFFFIMTWAYVYWYNF